MSLFADLERFVQACRPCGTMTADATEPTPHGYRLWLWCSCSAAFERWVTLEDADENLLRPWLAGSSS